MKNNIKGDGTVEQQTYSLKKALEIIFKERCKNGEEKRITSPDQLESDVYKHESENFVRAERRNLKSFFDRFLGENYFDKFKGANNHFAINENGLEFLRTYYGTNCLDGYELKSGKISPENAYMIYDFLQGMTVGATVEGRRDILITYQKKYDTALGKVLKDIDELKEIIARFYCDHAQKNMNDISEPSEDPEEDFEVYSDAYHLCNALVGTWREQVGGLVESFDRKNK